MKKYYITHAPMCGTNCTGREAPGSAWRHYETATEAEERARATFPGVYPYEVTIFPQNQHIITAQIYHGKRIQTIEETRPDLLRKLTENK